MPEQRSSDITQTYFRALVFVIALHVLSAVLFIALVRRPVYDDSYNIYDVHAYAAQGISVTTVQAQRNAPGPASFIWMSWAVRFVGGDELRDARIAVLLSWLLLTSVMLVGARRSTWPQLWYAALLATLIFPHSLTASATVLTEGPALMFAIFGAFAWTEFASRRGQSNFASLTLGMAGGLSIGLAITGRQYYLALLPAAGLLALLLFKDQLPERKKFWVGSVIVSLAIAAILVLLMVFTWGGITSPGIATGASYSNFHASAGLALARPLVVAFYVALYLLPFSFPAMWRIRVPWRWPAVLVASLVGLIALRFKGSILSPGPLHSLLTAASRIPSVAALLFWLIAGVIAFNSIAVATLLWTERSKLRACAPSVFAVLVVLFFIAEQLGVGGNIPFYDRYVLQLAPFLGLIGYWLFPNFTRVRIVALAGMAAISHVMLWRYAFLR